MAKRDEPPAEVEDKVDDSDVEVEVEDSDELLVPLAVAGGSVGLLIILCVCCCVIQPRRRRRIHATRKSKTS